MKKVLVWFRNDLRTHDHEILNYVLEKKHKVLPVFIFNEQNWNAPPTEPKKMGILRTQFLLECVENLKHNIHSLKGNLCVRYGSVEKLIPELCVQYGIEEVYCAHEPGTEEEELNDILERRLLKINVNLKLFYTNFLYNVSDIPFPIPRVPDVFTEYKNKLEKESFVAPELTYPLENLNFIPLQETNELPPLVKLSGHSKKELGHMEILYKGGEDEGLKQLNFYIFEKQYIKDYFNTRNQLSGKGFSSQLSPWLSFGCISPKRIFYQISKFENTITANKSTYWLKFELMWRDFFRLMMLKYKAKLFTETGFSGKTNKDLKPNKDLVNNWKQGKTKVPLIDALMTELNLTGYMSNRGRQIVASYFIHHLKQNWIAGAAYFENKLVDYDVSSNYGNWAYIAGAGNDPRGGRIFDLEKQVQEYDPEHRYIDFWLHKKDQHKLIFND